MSAPAFTPGPWSARRYAYERYTVQDARGSEIALCVRHGDACLIATATELYEHGYALLEAYNEGGDEVTLAPFVINLGRALRKARGEQ